MDGCGGTGAEEGVSEGETGVGVCDDYLRRRVFGGKRGGERELDAGIYIP